MYAALFFSFLFALPLCGALQILPPALEIGDTIGIVAPASPPKEDVQAISEGVRRLMSRGYKIKFAHNLMMRCGYLAGDDKERVKSLMDLWADDEVKAIWCYRGGFGSARILDQIDYNLIRERPKIFIGMSDITALHAAIGQKTGLVTFLGPNFGHTFVSPLGESQRYNENQLWQRVSEGRAGVYQMPRYFPHKGHVVKTIRGGVARGRLVGGTLSIVVSLIGTPWEIDTKGKILVLEEIDEEPYRIDRMLSQMKLSGHLNSLSGLILASWKGCLGRDKRKTLSIEEVFNHYFASAPYPVLLGFPVGHLPQQTTLPLHFEAELNATEKTVKLMRSPVVKKRRASY